MTFKKLQRTINTLHKHKNIHSCIIGHSVLGCPIYAFHVGDYSENQIIISGAIHAREWITALLVTKLCKVYSRKKIPGGIYFIPLCNPDGVEIALCKEPLWKANSRGVDLNVNFDADWGGGAQNIRTAGPENYIGPNPNSEPETLALIAFTKRINPKITIAYHSKGELIYYAATHSEQLAHLIGELTGYLPEKTVNSTGGYSDWVSMHLQIPALTIEVGHDDLPHPIGVKQLPKIFAQNKHVPQTLLRCISVSSTKTN
jgi:g-D-glutamyl-meso-diaminopimelate peptidase